MKTCVITGGSGGIGRAIAEKFLENGFTCIIVDVINPSGEKLKLALNTGKLKYFCGDISYEKTISDFGEYVRSNCEKIDVIINNACISNGGLPSCGYEDFLKVVKTGLVAPYFLVFVLQDRLSEGASIINIGSSRALMSQTGTESYTAAKGGIVALTHAMAVSLSGKARVNCVSPGWIDTSGWHDGDDMPSDRANDDEHSFCNPDAMQHPSGRIGKPEDIADLVCYLCSESAGFITGQNILVDGGMTKLMIYNGDAGWKYEI